MISSSRKFILFILFCTLFGPLTAICQQLEVNKYSMLDLGSYSVFYNKDAQGNVIWKTHIEEDGTMTGVVKSGKNLVVCAVNISDINLYWINEETGKIQYKSKANVKNELVSSIGKAYSVDMTSDTNGNVYLLRANKFYNELSATSFLEKFNAYGKKVWSEQAHPERLGSDVFFGGLHLYPIDYGYVLATHKTVDGFKGVHISGPNGVKSGRIYYGLNEEFDKARLRAKDYKNVIYAQPRGTEKKGMHFLVSNLAIDKRVEMPVGKVRVQRDFFSYDFNHSGTYVFSFVSSVKKAPQGGGRKLRHFTNTLVSFDGKGKELNRQDVYSERTDKSSIIKILAVEDDYIVCQTGDLIKLYDIDLKTEISQQQVKLEFKFRVDRHTIYNRDKELIYRIGREEFLHIKVKN